METKCDRIKKKAGAFSKILYQKIVLIGGPVHRKLQIGDKYGKGKHLGVGIWWDQIL